MVKDLVVASTSNVVAVVVAVGAEMTAVIIVAEAVIRKRDTKKLQSTIISKKVDPLKGSTFLFRVIENYYRFFLYILYLLLRLYTFQ